MLLTSWAGGSVLVKAEGNEVEVVVPWVDQKPTS